MGRSVLSVKITKLIWKEFYQSYFVQFLMLCLNMKTMVILKQTVTFIFCQILLTWLTRLSYF